MKVYVRAHAELAYWPARAAASGATASRPVRTDTRRALRICPMRPNASGTVTPPPTPQCQTASEPRPGEVPEDAKCQWAQLVAAVACGFEHRA